jgi:hypothetical protein
MSVPVLIEAVESEGFGGRGVVAAAFAGVQVAGVLDGRDDGRTRMVKWVADALPQAARAAGGGRGRQGGAGHPSCRQRRQAVHLLAVIDQQASSVPGQAA